jgi:hypothetical protein
MHQLFRPRSFVAAFLTALTGTMTWPAVAADAQIYQQRAADGRIVLTDRPSATAVTERTWQVEREDPAAAQQRAHEVRREAEAVSERVQRRIDAQERLAYADQERARQALRDREMQLALARADDDRYSAGGIVVPYPYRSLAHRRGPGLDQRPPPRKPGQRPARVTGPASP